MKVYHLQICVCGGEYMCICVSVCVYLCISISISIYFYFCKLSCCEYFLESGHH